MARFSCNRAIGEDIITSVERELTSIQYLRSSHKEQVSYSLFDIMQKVQHPDLGQKLEGIMMMRKSLKFGNDLGKALISVGVIPLLIDYLRQEDTILQFEAASALAGITSLQTEAVVECGAVPILITLLSSEHLGIREQAVKSLGNIAEAGPEQQEVLISSGLMPPLLKLVDKSAPLSLLQAASETILNLNRSNESLVAMIESGIVPELMPLLGMPENKMFEPALNMLSSILSGNDEQRQIVLDQGVLFHLNNMLHSPKPTITSVVLWTLTNITAGNQHQIQMVIDAQIISSVIQLLHKEDFDSQMYAALVICYLIKGGTSEQVSYVVQQGCIGPMCNLLTTQASWVVEEILNGLQTILKMAGSNFEATVKMIEEFGGKEKINQLRSHYNPGTAKAARTLMKLYYQEDGASSPCGTKRFKSSAFSDSSEDSDDKIRTLGSSTIAGFSFLDEVEGPRVIMLMQDFSSAHQAERSKSSESSEVSGDSE